MKINQSVVFNILLILLNFASMETIFIGLGSNISPKSEHISLAINEIEVIAGTILKASSLYQTKAWGKTDQSDFINQVIQIESKLSPMALLDTLLSIEKTIGRTRTEKWGKRKIDIDLLFYGQQIIEEPGLSVPHPFVQDRNFVLIPLLEIAPDFIHPAWQLSIKELTEKCQDQLQVERIKE